MQTTEQNTSLRLWTVAEYHRMVETGILAPDEPVELVAGQVIIPLLSVSGLKK